MATGDSAAARGMDLVSGSELANTIDTELNKDRDYIDKYSRWPNIAEKPSTYPPSAHTHDDRYYTETEVDAKLGTKSNNGHTHDDRYFTEAEVNSLLSGKSSTTHTHSLSSSQITGTLPVSKGGTGGADQRNALMNLGIIATDYGNRGPIPAGGSDTMYYTVEGSSVNYVVIPTVSDQRCTTSWGRQADGVIRLSVHNPTGSSISSVTLTALIVRITD